MEHCTPYEFPLSPKEDSTGKFSGKCFTVLKDHYAILISDPEKHSAAICVCYCYPINARSNCKQPKYKYYASLPFEGKISPSQSHGICSARTLKLLLKLNEVWRGILLWFQIYKVTAWERLGHFQQYSQVPSSPSTAETIIPRIWVCRSLLLSRLTDDSTKIIISWYSVNYSIHLQSTQPAFLSTQQFYYSHSSKRFYTQLST